MAVAESVKTKANSRNAAIVGWLINAVMLGLVCFMLMGYACGQNGNFADAVCSRSAGYAFIASAVFRDIVCGFGQHSGLLRVWTDTKVFNATEIRNRTVETGYYQYHLHGIGVGAFNRRIAGFGAKRILLRWYCQYPVYNSCGDLYRRIQAEEKKSSEQRSSISLLYRLA